MTKLIERFIRPAAVEDDAPKGSETIVKPHIRIINGTLDEDPSSISGIVIQGRLDLSTLRFLKIDKDYQRDLDRRPDIVDAYRTGKVVPNVEIGVRGQNFDTDGADFIIRDPAYIIDGWQRVGTAIDFLDHSPHHPIRLFASVHFGTDFAWEMQRFTDLNKNSKRISPNLHLRNLRNENAAVLTLFGLSNSVPTFPLRGKISWQQKMHRDHLVTALVFCKAVRILHGHQTTQRGVRPDQIASDLARAAENVSLHNLRNNAAAFISIIDDCWPFADIEYSRSAAHTKGSFLYECARMFSQHLNFWNQNGTVLMVSKDDRRKLSTFKIRDPQVVQLSGSGGAARSILYNLLVDHMNSGRRTQRLEPREQAGR